MNTQNETVQNDLVFELEKKVTLWVDTTFNFIKLEVLKNWVESEDNDLVQFIVPFTDEDIFEEWLSDMNFSTMASLWLYEQEDLEYESLPSSKNEFIESFGEENWSKFKEFHLDGFVGDLEEFRQQKEQDNYPVWTTVFEFRDSFYNNEDYVQKCINIGLGVIQGVDSFNNLLFMTSAGHSFFADYWIPLYLEFYPEEKMKYEGVDYSHI